MGANSAAWVKVIKGFLGSVIVAFLLFVGIPAIIGLGLMFGIVLGAIRMGIRK